MPPILDPVLVEEKYFMKKDVPISLDAVSKEYPPVNLTPANANDRPQIVNLFLDSGTVLPVNIATQLLFDKFLQIKSNTQIDELKSVDINMCLVLPQFFLLFLSEYQRSCSVDYLNDKEDLRDQTKKTHVNTILKTLKAYYEIMKRDGAITLPQLLSIPERKELS